jgi:hypothetical protein
VHAFHEIEQDLVEAEAARSGAIVELSVDSDARVATFPPRLDAADKDVCLRGLTALEVQEALVPSSTLGSSLLRAPAVEDHSGNAIHLFSRRTETCFSPAAGSPMQEGINHR